MIFNVFSYFSGHKHVILFPPVIENIVHHKHTFLNSPDGDGMFDVIGHSGVEWGNMHDGVNAISSDNFGPMEVYGGAHGQEWLKTTFDKKPDNVGGFDNNVFGTGFGTDNGWSLPNFNYR